MAKPGLHKKTSRPGALPIWPASEPLSPLGRSEYVVEVDNLVNFYDIEVRDTYRPKNGATTGTRVTHAAPIDNAIGAAGAGTISYRMVHTAPAMATITLDATITVVNDQTAESVREAIAAAFAPQISAAGVSDIITIESSEFGSVLFRGVARSGAWVTVTETARTAVGATISGFASTMMPDAGTIPAFLGQEAISTGLGTVKIATHVLWSQWTQIN